MRSCLRRASHHKDCLRFDSGLGPPVAVAAQRGPPRTRCKRVRALARDAGPVGDCPLLDLVRATTRSLPLARRRIVLRAPTPCPGAVSASPLRAQDTKGSRSGGWTLVTANRWRGNFTFRFRSSRLRSLHRVACCAGVGRSRVQAQHRVRVGAPILVPAAYRTIRTCASEKQTWCASAIPRRLATLVGLGRNWR